MEIVQVPTERVHETLNSRPEGLATPEVDERLRELGPNVLQAPRRFSWAGSLLRQFTNFFTILLNISAVICFIAHQLEPDESMNVLGFALLGVSVLNALFSFVQEYRAEKAMEALEKFLPRQVTVRREGREQMVLAEDLVPGDILLVAEGDRVSADARVVHSNGILVNNAPLTGESRPVAARADAVEDRLQEADNVLFAGCQVLRGTGEAVVFATGTRTEFGKIAVLSGGTQRTISPLQQETNHMVRVLTAIAVGMGTLFFLYGVAIERDLMVNLVFMMGIIVANVPEGLLPTFTLSLAMGSTRMAKRNVLVKTLNAVEAIGAVHVICTDKTGTLTRNELELTRLANPLTSGELDDEHARTLLRAAAIASEVHEKDGKLAGDPLDVEVARRLDELGGDHAAIEAALSERFAFDVSLRRAGGVLRHDEGCEFAVKGAWESLRPMLERVQTGSEAVPLDEAQVGVIDDVVFKLASRGYRVIAVAGRTLEHQEGTTPERETCERALTLFGFLCLEDPLRDEVPGAVAKCHQAGIDVVLITGDHPDTAQAVATRAGLIPDGADPATVTITGTVLQTLSADELAQRLQDGARVFARTTPEQKMKIVRALQSLEKIVAMTGDGVNDAPALKAADIGIAMGKGGTDVARESAQIILLDDNFASIVAGIEEGRTVFNNIHKFTNYVLVSNGPEILPYLLFILLPVPLALPGSQLLSIHLGTDIIPSMGLGQEPPDENTMRRPPRGRDQGLLRFPLIAHSYFFLGLLEALWSFALFFTVLNRGGWHYGDPIMAATDPLYQSATGIALSTILLMQIGNLLGRRDPEGSGLDTGIWKNRLILTGIIIQVVFSWATLYSPVMNRILGTQPVDPDIYLLAWLGIPLIFGADYLRKVIVRLLWPRPKGSGADETGSHPQLARA